MSGEYDKDKDYCTLSPDKLFGVNHNYGCYLHDRQYRNEVKNRKTRLESDKVLRDVIYKKYINAGKQRRGYIISRIYYYLVRLFGAFFWVK